MKPIRNIKKLRELVLEEAGKLRRFATLEERQRLTIRQIEPDSPQDCIYGQMTGYCFSKRAAELLAQCAVPYSYKPFRFAPPTRADFIKPPTEDFRNFSPVECYILTSSAKIIPLAEFIRGDRDTLTVEDL